MASAKFEHILDKFTTFTDKPVKYLTVQENIKDDIKNFVKNVYDFTISEEKVEKAKKKTALPELLVEDFDDEQIWQEIELQNNECWDNFVWEVANCISNKDHLVFPVTTSESKEQTADDDNNDEEELPSDIENAKSDDENSKADNENSKSDNECVKKRKKELSKPKFKGKSSIVDDQFFKLQEMEDFLLKEEKNDGKPAKEDSDEESIDMFEDMDEESDEENGGKEVKYSDFFDVDETNRENDYENDDDESHMDYDDDDNEEDFEKNIPVKETKKLKKGEKKVRFSQVNSSDDESEKSDKESAENKPTNQLERKSEFEMRQERLNQTISRLEEKTMKEAPWQLKGEVDARKRPQNSLLEEVVDFDMTSRPAPIITEQTTLTLEDIIRQRIKDKAWDDVAKKEKPVDDQLSFRKPEVLDQSKSKMSLAQVYEAEYLKQKQIASGEKQEEAEPESHKEIREAMQKVFAKLDALSHYHYTPRPPQAEVKIVTNTPAISMEEVAPIATSDAALLAPEEVKKKRRGDLMTKEERTQTDKNRERRKKKKLQKKKGQIPKVTDHRNTKKAVEATDKSLKTSKAFFEQLNDNSNSLIKSNNSKNKRNAKNKG